MKLNINGINHHILIDESKLDAEKIPVLFLHGFTGSSEDWQFIFDKIPDEFFPFAIDLIGHGKTDSPHDKKFYSCLSLISQIKSIIEFFHFSKIVLVGYSMGGRVALSFAVKNHSNLVGLILESTTAGIENINERKSRVENDFILAENILQNGIENFIDYWFNTPLFKKLKTLSSFDEIIQKRKKNNPIGLANTLFSFSTGLMSNHWEKLNSLEVPTLLITGEDDEKYTSINKKMNSLIKNSSHKILQNTSHNTHLEKPELFTNLVIEFLNKLKGSNEIQLD